MKNFVIKIRSFLFSSLLGGIIVILPLILTIALFGFLYGFISSALETYAVEIMGLLKVNRFFANIIIVGGLLFLCFFMGTLLRTRGGKFLFHFVERRLFMLIPGYRMIKDTVSQFSGGMEKKSLTTVALTDLFGTGVLSTTYVVDEYEGMVTVFMPTGPNPTSGNIYHVPSDKVHILDLPPDTAMRTILGVGVGSSTLLQEFIKKTDNE